MKKTLSVVLVLIPVIVFAQYPANPSKMRLGVQTSGAGLVFVGDSIPDWTPVSVNNAWMSLDTTNNVLYCWNPSTPGWEPCVVGDGNGIYSDTGTVAAIPDFFVRVRPDTTFSIGECINCDGFEDFWDNFAFETEFNGVFVSPGYWGGGGYQHVELGPGPSFEYEVDSELSTGPNSFNIRAYHRHVPSDSVFGANIYAFTRKATSNPAEVGVVTFTGIPLTGIPYIYQFPTVTPSTTLNDTTIMAWRGTGAAAEPIGFLPYFSASDFCPKYDTSLVSAATLNIDLETDCNKTVKIDLDGNAAVTLTFSNPGAVGSQYNFHIANVDAGGSAVTWPGAFLDMDGAAMGAVLYPTGTRVWCYYDGTNYNCQ